MKNKSLIIILVIVIGLSISATLLYPEIKEYKKVEEDNKSYQELSKKELNDQKYNTSLKMELINLKELNKLTNESKEEIDYINKEIEELSKKEKELNNKLKSINSKINTKTKEKNSLLELYG